MKTVAIIINYRSADLTLGAVQSVLESTSLGPVRVVVVDNSEDCDEAERLRLGLSPGVALRVSPGNIGFGRACNLAFEQFEEEQILLINPDAKLLPGCLLRLQKTLLSSKNIGAVSPQIFWDDGLKFYLPPSNSLFYLDSQPFFDSGGPQAPISRFLSVVWRYYSIRVWRSKKPVRVNNLSGGLVLLKRDAVRTAGGLFDPRFFLYFEDTDLFLRLRKAGYTLLIEPKAKAIHYYDQCGQEDWEPKRLHMARSHLLFLEKHCKGLKPRIRKIMDHLVPLATGERNRALQPRFTSPFILEVPFRLHKGWLFEVSPNPVFIPSAGWFGKGNLMDFTEKYWSMLTLGQYFGRLGKPTGYSRRSEVISWVVEEGI